MTLSRTPSVRLAAASRFITLGALGIALAPMGAQAPGAADYAAAMDAAARRDWNTAGASMEKAVRADSSNASYHYWLGKAYSQRAATASILTRTRLAPRFIAAWERSIALDSTYDAAYEDLIPMYAQLPGIVGGSKSKAEALLARWLRIHPYAAGLARVRFDVARNLSAEATANGQAMVAAFPDSTRPVYELVIAYQRASRFPEARTTVERGLLRWPDEPRLLYAVGRAAAASGEELDRGEAALRRLLANERQLDDPLRANTRYRLGAILERRGDKTGARAEYERALAIIPTLRDAKAGLERVRR